MISHTKSACVNLSTASISEISVVSPAANCENIRESELAEPIQPDYKLLISETEHLRNELRCVESGLSLFQSEIRDSLQNSLCLDFLN